MAVSLFVSFNPKSEAEKSTALRLQTISYLYGFSVVLPFRAAPAAPLHRETKRRIETSSIFLALCIDRMSKTLLDEIQLAKDKSKPLLLLYDKNKKAPNLPFKSANLKLVAVDFKNTDNALHNIAEFIRTKFKPKTADKKDSDLGIALIGIGLGLLAAWAISDKE